MKRKHRGALELIWGKIEPAGNMQMRKIMRPLFIELGTDFLAYEKALVLVAATV